MKPSNIESYSESLRRRRSEILLTREYLQKERRALDESKDWIDHAAYATRVALLDNLVEGYVQEWARIDAALTRITEGQYDVCLACHAPIEARRLDPVPEAAFCPGCQEMREKLTDT